MASNWYYARRQKQKGPVSLESSRALCESGEIRPDDLVWSDGMLKWVTAQTVPDLFGAGKLPPPLPSPLAMASAKMSARMKMLADSLKNHSATQQISNAEVNSDDTSAFRPSDESVVSSKGESRKVPAVPVQNEGKVDWKNVGIRALKIGGTVGLTAAAMAAKAYQAGNPQTVCPFRRHPDSGVWCNSSRDWTCRKCKMQLPH